MTALELYECSRLCAKITKQACEKNRAAGVIFACSDCPGLDTKEALVAVKQCSVEGCESLVHARGMCWKHERSELGINPNTGKPLEAKKPKAAVILKPAKVKPLPVKLVDPEYTPAPFLPMTMQTQPDMVVFDMSAEIDALLIKRRNEWFDDLSGATSLRLRAEMFVSMCKTIEGLVY